MQERSKAGLDVTASPSATGSWSSTGTVQEDPEAGLNGVATDVQDDDQTVTDSATTTEDDRPAFLSELAEAMQTIVAAERARVAEETEARRQAWLDLATKRDALEAERLRAIATDDTKAIERWVAAETKRIQREGERRRKEVQKDLDTNLAAHRSAFDAAIERVEQAIAAYRTEVEQFFSGFDGVRNPVAIAGRATERPEFPTLEPLPDTMTSQASAAVDGAATDVPAEAVADDDIASDAAATEDTTAVGAMDAEGIGRVDDALPEPDAAPLAEADADATVKEREAEPEDGRPRTGTSGSLLQTVPALRPMSSWLRRDQQDDDSTTP